MGDKSKELNDDIKKMNESIKRLDEISCSIDPLHELNRLNNSINPLRSISRLNQLSGSSALAGMGKAMRTLVEMQERNKLIANDFVTRGIIKNSEAATALLKPGIFIPKVPVLTHLQMSDAIISLRKNMNLLKDSRIPHMSLYRNILDSIGDRNLESIEALAMDENASLADIDDSENLENIEAIRPYFYDAAIKIEVYLNITENHIQDNGSEEEKTLWDKYVKKLLLGIQSLFVIWAFSDTPLKDWNIYKAFEKAAYVIDNYEQPTLKKDDIEIESKDNETNDINDLKDFIDIKN